MNEHVLTPAQRQAFTRLRAMMQAYLVERDTEKALSFFTENTHSIGTGVQEIALNKAGLYLRTKFTTTRCRFKLPTRRFPPQAGKTTEPFPFMPCFR